MTCPVKSCPQPGHSRGTWIASEDRVEGPDETIAADAYHEDAFLMAAAPDMAHALAMLLALHRDGMADNVIASDLVLGMAEAALAKARGE